MNNKIYKHSALNILDTFSKTELKELKKFVNSPYINSHRIIIKLTDEILKRLKSHKNDSTFKSILLKTVSPTGKESTLRDAMSILTKLLLDFIGMEKIKREKLFKYSYTMKGLTEKNLNDLFEKFELKAEDELQKIKLNSFVDYYFYQYLINQIKYDDLIQHRHNKKFTLNEIDVQNKIFSGLVNHFLLQSFRIYYDMSTYHNIFDIKPESYSIGKIYSKNIITDIIKIIKTENEQSFIYNIYISLKRLKTRGLSEDFEKYKNQVEKNRSKLSNDELLFHNLELIDYCVKKSSYIADDKYYANELFKLYNFILKKGIYKKMTIEGSMLPELFINILINAIELNKIKWLNIFIKKYLNELSKTERENIENISFAILNNATQNYNTSLVFAKKIKETNKNSLKIRRVVIIRNYFELNNFENALSEITNFKALLRRTTILTEVEKKKINTFIKLTREIINFKLGGTDLIKSDILSEITDFKHSWFYKDWLLSKVKEL